MSERMNGDLSGRTLGGRYEVQGELGRGGMARVYRGTDTVLGRPVAVKVLAPQYADDANFVTRFRREAQAAARLNHPNLVQVYDTGSDDGVHYIVMEYVEARTLADFLAGGGRIMPERAVELAEAVCDALAVAHAQGVIHRDVKPANIMVTRDGHVKVTDFGIARVASNETIAQTAAVLGTASYLSPEQAQGSTVDQRTDLYSLGCVLYEMLTGRAPFTGNSPVAVASKHVLEQPVPPSQLNPDVSRELNSVVMRALAKNADNRYQSAHEMKEDLERARRGLPVMATPLLPDGAPTTQVIHRAEPQPTAVLPPGAPGEPREPDRTPGWLIALIVLLVLGVLGALLWLFARNVLSSNPSVETVKVPDVIGDTLKEATAKLEAVGLRVAEPVHRQASPRPPGTVLKTVPAAGTPVQKHAAITVTIAKVQIATIPTDMVDQPVGQVLDELDALGFKDVTKQGEQSPDIKEGNVTRTDPPEGSKVTVDTPITVYYSTGPGTVAVPDVTCDSFGAAKSELRDAGLVAVISDQAVEINPLCPNGNKVAAQDPASGAEVQPGTSVTLYPGSEQSPSPSPSE